MRGVGGEVAGPGPVEDGRAHRDDEDGADGDRGEVVGGVDEERVNRAKEAHREISLADLGVHLPDDPVPVRRRTIRVARK